MRKTRAKKRPLLPDPRFNDPPRNSFCEQHDVRRKEVNRLQNLLRCY